MIELREMCADLTKVRSHLGQQSNDMIRSIYHILRSPSVKTKQMTEGWKRDFRYVYGDVKANLSSNNKLNVTGVLERYGISPEGAQETEQIQLLFFAVQTYFSVLIKVIMCDVLSGPSADKMSLEEIVLGDFARQKGIANYCYPDLYCWPVFEAGQGFDKVLDEIKSCVANYRTDLPVTEFAKSNNYDYIKQMYEAVIPKELRHALGEYYTPDWLAEETLKTAISFVGNGKGKRFIDPTCGSGTFLFQTIIEKRKHGEGLADILGSVAGMDINPLAILTAKTNYLLAVIDLIDGEKEMEIPVYNMDLLKFDEPVEDGEVSDFLTCPNPEGVIAAYRNADRKRAVHREKADCIMGNPPWVNWEYMPEEYRAGSQHLWTDYMLFSAKGRDLSFSKEDISVLVTYIAMDKLLADGGILAFVIRQGVFKSAQNGVGFRRFRLKEECGIKVLRADDLSLIKAFDNATTTAALIYLKKGEETVYPVPYILWTKRPDLRKVTFHAYSELSRVKQQILPVRQQAIPAVKDDATSMWLTACEQDMKKMGSVLGTNRYKARTGVFTGGANAVYWLNILGCTGGEIQVTNVVDRAKRKVAKVVKTIEKDHVYPMLKGSGVKKWNVSYDTYLLCPHTAETKMWPVSGEALKNDAPKTYQYLQGFKQQLDARRGFAGWEKEIQRQEFQAILRVGSYTFSRYKVVWKYIASEFICAVISDVEDPYLGKKMLMPNEKIMYISTEDEMEAYYLCGVLSSTLVANCVKGYMNPTSISAHVLNKLNIPAFDQNSQEHLAIAELCREGHGKDEMGDYIAGIDEVVERLF